MKKATKLLSALLLLLTICVALSGCEILLAELEGIFGTGDVGYTSEVPVNVVIGGEKIPAFTGDGYYAVNGNKPFFTDDEITDKGFYRYSELDSLGRAGMAWGSIGPETMPTDEREDINHITPSGWKYNGKSNNNKYDKSTGVNTYIYNRAHILANQLVSDDVDVRNFFTGTCDMNQKHMLKFENMVADFVKETDEHVMYRVTPYFEGQNLICSGVLMEGYSVEDEGESVEFCVFVYNAQPKIYINYLTGENCLASEMDSEAMLPSDDACAHINTETRNKKTASCKVEGYTGDTFCADCGAEVAQGEIIEKLTTHNWGSWSSVSGTLKQSHACNICGKREERVDPNKIQENVPEALLINGEVIPQFIGDGYYVVNGGVPFFNEDEITDKGFYTFSALDALGRAGTAFGSIGKDTFPSDPREASSSMTPSGWKYNGSSNNNKYDIIPGKYIYNRSHLIANMLASEDVDKRNFVTGTRDFNQIHMKKFETMVQDYIKETSDHVMYRVTPYFEGENLICSGVLMEALSVSDRGESLSFCVFVYNAQPGIYINYATGENHLLQGSATVCVVAILPTRRLYA